MSVYYGAIQRYHVAAHHSTELCGLSYVDEALFFCICSQNNLSLIASNASYKQCHATSGVTLVTSVNICACYASPTWCTGPLLPLLTGFLYKVNFSLFLCIPNTNKGKRAY